jgi:uncharacterized membrane protein YkvA (DUF1232 family)
LKLLARLKEKAKNLKAELGVLRIAYADQRTPWSARLLIGLTIGYLLSPIDLIPDFIPVLGLLDDLLLVPVLISLSIKLIPPIVMSEARQKLQNQPHSSKKDNWFFGLLIIFLWAVVLFWLGRSLGMFGE